MRSDESSVNEVSEEIFNKYDEVFRRLQRSEEVDKAIRALERLKLDSINIRLLFLKYLLDQQMTTEKVAQEYVTKYEKLSEYEKWSIAQALDKAYQYNPDAWREDIDYAIDVMEHKYYSVEE